MTSPLQALKLYDCQRCEPLPREILSTSWVTNNNPWLTTGLHNLDFSFDSELKSNYKDPYYIGYIHLTDLGQLNRFLNMISQLHSTN